MHSVSDKAIVRLISLLVNGQSPDDLRGKHLKRSNTLEPDVIAKIDAHIKSIPSHQSHYSGKVISYLDSDLNVKKMHNLFCEQNPNVKVKYEYYLKYYNENFQYRFGRPQVDVCSACVELQVKIKSPFLNENEKRVAVAELLVHNRQASKF